MILELREKNLWGNEGCIKSIITPSILIFTLLSNWQRFWLIIFKVQINVWSIGKVA